MSLNLATQKTHGYVIELNTNKMTRAHLSKKLQQLPCFHQKGELLQVLKKTATPRTETKAIPTTQTARITLEPEDYFSNPSFLKSLRLS